MIRQGLDETLTVQRLGLTAALLRTLRTAHDEHHREPEKQRRVPHVERQALAGGQMIQRRVASALVEAEQHCLPRSSGRWRPAFSTCPTM